MSHHIKNLSTMKRLPNTRIGGNASGSQTRQTLANSIRIVMMALVMAIAIPASAMTYKEARKQALFLADKMAYELSLNDRQYEAAYEINLDYLMAVGDRDDVYAKCWSRRNMQMQRVLTAWQYSKFAAAEYFYRPVYWAKNRWNWRIYNRYSSGKYFNAKPAAYKTYRGGNSSKGNKPQMWAKPSKGNNNRTFGNLKPSANQPSQPYASKDKTTQGKGKQDQTGKKDYGKRQTKNDSRVFDGRR